MQQITPHHYSINSLSIAWGKRFNEVAPLLNGFEKFKSYGGWSNVRLKGTSIFGLRCGEIQVRAPFEDRPVLQVIYQLTSVEATSTDNMHQQFLDHLVRELGSPVKTASYYDKNDWRKGLSPTSVVFTATWETGDVRIGLSVYGGARAEETGTYAAGLYVNWIDELKAAQPLREEVQKFEQSVNAALNASVVIHKSDLHCKQYPIVVKHYENADPDAAEHDRELRAAQLALYRMRTFITPAYIHAQLGDTEIAVFRIPELRKTFVSNKWDTTYLEDHDTAVPVFFEVHPARGPGGRELEINRIIFADSWGSNSLLDVMQWIERSSGVQTTMSERMDD